MYDTDTRTEEVAQLAWERDHPRTLAVLQEWERDLAHTRAVQLYSIGMFTAQELAIELSAELCDGKYRRRMSWAAAHDARLVAAREAIDPHAEALAVRRLVDSLSSGSYLKADRALRELLALYRDMPYVERRRYVVERANLLCPRDVRPLLKLTDGPALSRKALELMGSASRARQARSISVLDKAVQRSLQGRTRKEA